MLERDLRFSTWLGRVLKRHNFSNRKQTISQSIPSDWKKIALDSTAVIRNSFSAADVDHIIAMDETFIKFDETQDKLIVPKGIKRESGLEEQSTTRKRASRCWLPLI
jgi:hypothetical protein